MQFSPIRPAEECVSGCVGRRQPAKATHRPGGGERLQTSSWQLLYLIYTARFFEDGKRYSKGSYFVVFYER